MEKCKRCEHEWEPKITSPNICPRCKSRFWKTPKIRAWESLDDRSAVELIAYLKTNPHDVFKDCAPGANDRLNTEVLGIMVDMLCQSEIIIENNPEWSGVVEACKYIDVCKDMVVHNILPKEMSMVFTRIMTDMMRDSNCHKVDKNTECLLKRELVSKWDSLEISKIIEIVAVEHILPDGDRVDILGKEIGTDRDVIIELKKGNRNAYKQLRSYSFNFDNPILINISEIEVLSKRRGIEYYTFADIHGKSLIPAPLRQLQVTE